MERATTTASRLDAEQDSGKINRTQSMATLNESFPQGTDSGSGPRCQDTILGGVDAQTRFETTFKHSNDPPLSRVYTLRNGEDSMKLLELMELCTKLSDLTSIRSDLHLKDAGGTDCLPTDTIFEELARMGRKQKKTTTVPHPSDSTADVLNEEYVPTHSNDPLLSGEDRLKLTDLMDMCTKLSERVLDLEHTKTAQAQEITNLKLREDASKQGRKITDLDANAEQEKDVVEKEVSTVNPVIIAGEVVTSANVEVITVKAPTTTIDELTLAQTLIEIKAAKPKAVTSAATTTTTIRPKAKGVVVQEPKVARNLKAQLQPELEEEEKLSRLKKEEANIALLGSWDNTQAIMDADFQLAQ
ncbi:hypothetical protein Tco_0981059 [Tanacetum coccineum]